MLESTPYPWVDENKQVMGRVDKGQHSASATNWEEITLSVQCWCFHRFRLPYADTIVWWLKQKKFIHHGSGGWKSKVQVFVDPVFGKAPFLVCRCPILCFLMGWRSERVCVPWVLHRHSSHYGAGLHLHGVMTTQACLLTLSPWELGSKIWIWGDSSIQSTATGEFWNHSAWLKETDTTK
jgi:hypothetical protein